ncbi:S8 family serine peptidase, partial [Kitasatospora sp. MBT66]|uniref:S8 family serine peptidase n=1 Tax=Kitasatospora sp. MBT66 TaxID=1444769 RepID=UPI0005B91373
VDLAAPGIDIFSACAASSGYCKGHGTSDATALVSASAALVWAAHPEWTANQVARVLLNTAGKADDGAQRNDAIGYGIVRPRVALTEPGDPGPADVYPIQEQPVGQSAPSGSAAPSASAPTPVVSQSPAAQPAPTPPLSASAAPAAEQKDEGSALVLVASVAGGLVLVAAVLVVLLRRRRA